MCGPAHHLEHGHNHQGHVETPVTTGKPQPEMRPCPRCGAEVQEDFVFCPRCGAELLTACPNCHRAVETGWTHCAYCGAELVGA